MKDSTGPIREYNGTDIIELPDEIYIPIVDSIIHRGELVIMSGNAKSNKSTFAMQLACAVSSGTPFLDVFNVPKPMVVWYFSTEGNDIEFRERIIRMKRKVKVDLDNIFLFCSTQFKINTPEGIKIVNQILKKYEKNIPDLIIIDSLYSSFYGKLAEDDVVNNYITIIILF